MSNQDQPKPGIEQQAGNSRLGGGMMANQGDNNNQVQGDNNIQQQNDNQAQINRDGSTGIQVRANGETIYIAKEINQYNNCTIVIGQNGGNSGNNRKEYNFQAYLSNIVQKYQHWSSFYTPASACNKPVDMKLMVQWIQPQKGGIALGGEQNEKIETLRVIEAISKYASEHVLLVGKPGSGKSTALQRLLWETADKIIKGENKLDVIPLLVELRAWQTQTTCVTELIQKIFRQNSLRLTKEEIADLLFDGRFLLLLDGLNELPNDESQRIVADFQEEYPQTKMIFTTRDLAVGGNFGVRKQLSMQPLTEEQMRQFVKAYLPEQEEGMLKQLGDRLRELGETPLILKMLCDVFDEEKQIPNSRGELFRYFDREFDKLKGQVPVTDKLRQWKAELLQNLAFAMMRGEKITDLRLVISRTQAEDILEESLSGRVNFPGEKAKDWLLDLLKHYLIQTVDGKEIQFHHQLFQEYYAAEYLLRILPSLSDDKLKKDYLNLLKWTEPLALMLALVDEESQAIRVVRLALDVDLMLGSRLAGEVKHKFQERTVGFILEKKLPKIIEVDFLGITRSEFAVTPLLSKLNDRDSSIRKNVANALGEIGNEIAVDALIKVLNDEDSSVCTIAVDIFGKIGNQVATNALIDTLKHKDSQVRMHAATTLGKIGNNAASNALIQALNGNDSSLHVVAALALGKICNETVVNTLINALNNQDSSVYFCVTHALAEIGNKTAIHALANALNNKDLSIREHATYALSRIDNKAAFNILINALNHEDLSVRSSAADALGRIGDKVAVNDLINVLNDKSQSVRINATDALGKIGDKVAVNALINALNDEDSTVRCNATNALGKIGEKTAVNALINVLNDKDLSVRRSASDALGKIGDEAAVDALINVLDDEDSSVRISVADALAKIGNESAVNALFGALNDINSLACSSAALTLFENGDKNIVNILIKSLNSENLEISNKAALTLGRIGNDVAVKALIQALNDIQLNSSVRWRAAEALGEIGSETAVNALVNTLHVNPLNDENLPLHVCVALTLGNVRNIAAANTLINVLYSPYSWIYPSVAKALSKILHYSKITEIGQMLLSGKYEVKEILLKTQEYYKFYNYEILCSSTTNIR